jgi:hypothetical protein
VRGFLFAFLLRMRPYIVGQGGGKSLALLSTAVRWLHRLGLTPSLMGSFLVLLSP